MVNVLKCKHFSHSVLNKMFVIKAGYCNMLVRVANWEDPDQKQSDLGVQCLPELFLEDNLTPAVKFLELIFCDIFFIFSFSKVCSQ